MRVLARAAPIGAGDLQIIPERVADHEECDVLGLRPPQDLVAVGLDHFPVGDDDGPAIITLLLRH